MTTPKLCKDCKHYKANKIKTFFNGFDYSLCLNIKLSEINVSKVTGKEKITHNRCEYLRNNFNSFACGPDAKLFEEKEK